MDLEDSPAGRKGAIDCAEAFKVGIVVDLVKYTVELSKNLQKKLGILAAPTSTYPITYILCCILYIIVYIFYVYYYFT